MRFFKELLFGKDQKKPKEYVRNNLYNFYEITQTKLLLFSA